MRDVNSNDGYEIPSTIARIFRIFPSFLEQSHDSTNKLCIFYKQNFNNFQCNMAKGRKKKTDDKCVCTKGKHPKKERTSIQKTFDGMLNSLSTQTSSKHMESIFSVQTKHCVVIRDVFVSIKRIKYYFSETIPGHFIYTMHLGLIAIQFDL